jgi:hypothetical protein
MDEIRVRLGSSLLVVLLLAPAAWAQTGAPATGPAPAAPPTDTLGRDTPRGTVLGFMGNTGDASTTPYHLHFEIHPVGLLYLGYDGAVDPTSYLTAWEHVQDIDFAQVAGWAPPISATSSAPKPGAVLLSQTDISTADGLDPESLRQALKQPGKSDGG